MIETERLVLREMTSGDVDDLLVVFGDPKVMASFGEPPFTCKQMTMWVERNLEHQRRHGYGLFAVILKAEGRLVGDCGLEQMQLDGEDVLELGYDFASAYWNRGLATEAACAVRDYAFGTLAAHRLASLIRTHNVASRRVSEKVGMTLCRTLVRHGNDYFLYTIDRGIAEPDG